jgi:transposase
MALMEEPTPTRKEQNLSRGATDWLEGRRLRAWELHKLGWTQRRIAEALGVTQGAISQWLRRVRDAGGVEGLYRRSNKGAKPKLTPEQVGQLPSLLEQGPQAFGWWEDVWTRDRVCALIENRFGVRYHPTQVGHILRKIGWTPQKPVRKAVERDEAAIEQWKREEWPALKKSG